MLNNNNYYEFGNSNGQNNFFDQLSFHNLTAKKEPYKNNENRFYYGQTSEKERIAAKKIPGVQLFNNINTNLLIM